MRATYKRSTGCGAQKTRGLCNAYILEVDLAGEKAKNILNLILKNRCFSPDVAIPIAKLLLVRHLLTGSSMIVKMPNSIYSSRISRKKPLPSLRLLFVLPIVLESTGYDQP